MLIESTLINSFIFGNELRITFRKKKYCRLNYSKLTIERKYELNEILKFVIDKSGCSDDDATPQCDIINDFIIY